MHVLRLAPGGGADHLRRLPRGIVEIPLLPAPRIRRPRHLLRRSGGEVGAHAPGAGVLRRIRRVAHAFPVFPGIGHALGRAVALQQEAGFEGDLRFRRHLAEIPHHGRQHIAPGLEIRGEVDGFIAPVEEIPARRARGHTPAVGEKLVAIVGAGMHHEMFGFCRQIERAAEMVDAVFRGRRTGDANPVRAPHAPQPIVLRQGRQNRSPAHARQKRASGRKKFTHGETLADGGEG